MVWTVVKDGWQGNMAGALISKRNHGKKLFLKHTNLCSGFHIAFIRVPPENSYATCPGSPSAHHLRWKDRSLMSSFSVKWEVKSAASPISRVLYPIKQLLENTFIAISCKLFYK